MVLKWFKTEDGKKALAAGYVVALVIIAIDAVRYVISWVTDYIGSGENYEMTVASYGYLFGLIVATIILVYLICKCDWSST